MDEEKPFVGEQSPRIALDNKTPHGIRQAGLALVKGKRYTGASSSKARRKRISQWPWSGAAVRTIGRSFLLRV